MAEAFAGIAANGVNKLVDTGIGEKCCHHVGNMTTKGEGKQGDRYDRERSREGREARSGSRRRRRSSHSRHQSEDEDKPWSRKSYWKSSSRQQKPTSEPRRSFDQESEGEWSRKTYWRRSWQQQQPVRKEEESPAREKSAMKVDREAEQARMQRLEQFQMAKSRYLPADTRSIDQLPWEADRLYADVGRAVREANRRSGEQVRE